ncbi:MAG: DUF4421 family protein [Bacteroidales bacterium]|nr:DUF4421 family protein [Bacteroidales bacterium]
MIIGLVFPCNAQEKTTLFDKVLGLISAPSRELDPTAVYQRAPSWTVSISSELRHAGINQKNDFNLKYIDSYGIPQTYLIGSMDSWLYGGYDKSVGIQVGYGNLSLGWNQKLFGDKEFKNSNLSFDFTSSGYAFQFQYMDFTHPMGYELSIGVPDTDDYSDTSGETENPARLRAFIADVSYSFNRRSFAYSAVYKGDKVQRRSAGSFMFGSKVINGLVESSPEDLISAMSAGVSRYTTTQVSFGGGYSYNFVAFHRQPDESTGKGLRNLTFNLTAIPMVTLFNKFSSTTYEVDDNIGEFVKGSTTSMNGNLLINYVTRAGMIYSKENKYFSLYGSYDSFSFKGKMSIPYKDQYINDCKITGRFARWSVGLRFGVKF